MKRLLSLAAMLLVCCVTLFAQQALWGGAAVVSPDIHDDNTVTFRLKAPKAVRVQITGDFLPPQTIKTPRGDYDAPGIADGDDFGLVVQRCGQRGNGPAGGDFPMRRVHARHKLFSGIVREHFQTESFLQIPAFLFGIPSREGFMFSEPCRFQRNGLGGVPDLGQAGQKQQGRTQPSKQFMHVKPPITDCFAIKRTSNSYAMSRYARKGP